MSDKMPSIDHHFASILLDFVCISSVMDKLTDESRAMIENLDKKNNSSKSQLTVEMKRTAM